MKPAVLTEEVLKKHLSSLKGWAHEGNSIKRKVELEDFVHAMGFVNSVALLAEKLNHHPDIDIRWNTVTLVLSTHSAGGLTDLDMKLAEMINAL
jgi:4a-hydroxytetrahydrobiopterin dehydratase